MNWTELLLGQIPEAVYFVLFLIFVKKLDKKRLSFGLVVVIEYVLLLNIFPSTWYFHIIFMCLLYIILKIFYSNKSQITDVFVILIGYIFLIFTSVISYGIVYITCKNLIFATILNRVLVFVTLFKFNYKLGVIQNLYKFNWNRSSNKKVMKSATFRSLNLVILYLSFAIINFGMAYRVMLG